MKNYLEHVHITVTDLDGTIKFIQTALPDFKVRERFVLKNARFTEWVHIGTDETYFTLVKKISSELKSGLHKIEKNKYYFTNDFGEWIEWVLKAIFRKRKNKAKRPNALSPGVNHIGFVVKDLEGVVNRLKAANYKGSINNGNIMVAEPYRKNAYFLANEGNIEYEFTEYLTDDIDLRNTYHDIIKVEDLISKKT